MFGHRVVAASAGLVASHHLLDAATRLAGEEDQHQEVPLRMRPGLVADLRLVQW